jgi:histidine decarboxylase
VGETWFAAEKRDSVGIFYSLLESALNGSDSSLLAPMTTPEFSNIPETFPLFDGSDLDPSLFTLSPEGLSEPARKSALNALSEFVTKQRSHSLGYQANQYGMYGDLAEYLTLHMNNIGDPFLEGNYTLNSKIMERAVLDYFAQLWHAETPHDPNNHNSYWGYVLTMGSTEGNLYGLWNARDYLAGKALLDDPETVPQASAGGEAGSGNILRRLIWHQAPIPKQNKNAYTPVAFYSQDTHYSVIKIMRLLGIKTFFEVGQNEFPKQCPLSEYKAKGEWPQEVPSEGGPLGPGSIDVDALTRLVYFFAEQGYPILLCLNYGTTFKGAYDNVQLICERLQPIFEKFGLESREVIYDPATGARDIRTGFWIHVDGALGATYMPFLEMAQAQGKIPSHGPSFDFRLPYVHSICTSGHKWIGAPFPTGIYMTRVKHQLRPPSDPAYIGSPDTTLSGSRSGLAPIVLWYYLANHSHQAQVERALRCEDLATYTYDRLLGLSKSLRKDLWVQRTPLSLAILFRKPRAELIHKYTLSCESLNVDGKQRDYAHVYMMESVTRRKIDGLIEDLSQPDAFPAQAQTPDPLPMARPLTAGTARPLTHVPLTGRGWR